MIVTYYTHLPIIKYINKIHIQYFNKIKYLNVTQLFKAAYGFLQTQ